MGPNYIALAIPFFFLLIGVELLVARRQRRKSYRFADAIADLGCGVGQRVLLLFFEGGLLAVYIAFYQHARIVDVGRWPALAWVVAIVGVDFIYYWWHRASHRVNMMWAAHIVHHQSEDYNLAVALRQAVLTPITNLPFSLPLALIGVPPLVYVAAESINILYQFWIHTETVRRLGPLEAVLNTPSHHRVHHARDPQYLDRNYAGMFIVWDRLFGTYEPEREPPTYGITKPLRSFNPLWAQVHYLVELAGLARAAPSFREGLRLWLAPPDRTGHPALAPAATAAAPVEKYDVPVSGRLRAYVAANFALASIATFSLMMWQSALSHLALVAGVAAVLLTTATLAGLMERKPWALPLERLRVGLVLAGAIVVVVAR
jgi:sterol desaturase/sphingolipid hydroxylase (fatty acid hydroxylase superfamily)